MSRKASNIATLAHYGIRVPLGFHLDRSHYHEAIEPILLELIHHVRDVTEVQRLFSGIDLPNRTIEALREGLSKIPEASPLAVRSSGDIVVNGRPIAEDGSETSLAGQFESFLNVPQDLADVAVRRCWASLFNDRSIKSFAANEDYVRKSTMTVLVQEMVPAAASAVIMTVDPLGDGTVGGIELAVGPCEAIVGGVVTPDSVTFDRRSGAILECRIGAKEFAIAYQPFAGGRDNVLKMPLSDSVRNELAVERDVIHKIISIAREIEEIFGIPQDIELVVGRSGQVTVVQARPIAGIAMAVTPFKFT